MTTIDCRFGPASHHRPKQQQYKAVHLAVCVCLCVSVSVCLLIAKWCWGGLAGVAEAASGGAGRDHSET